jgi:hypothetical protein
MKISNINGSNALLLLGLYEDWKSVWGFGAELSVHLYVEVKNVSSLNALNFGFCVPYHILST